MDKGPKDKDQAGKESGLEVELGGVGESGGEKWRQLYLNNNKKWFSL